MSSVGLVSSRFMASMADRKDDDDSVDKGERSTSFRETFGPKKDITTKAEEYIFNSDRIINLLRNAERYTTVILDDNDVDHTLTNVRQVFMEQPMLLEIHAPVRVFGDIHGQFADLLDAFDTVGWPDATNRTLFLGDYVDRGKYGIETIVLLFCLKIQLPKNIFLLRGNHESQSISRVYGFYDECKKKYSVEKWRQFLDVFDCMPVAALINNLILCMHGGLSPNLNQLDDIRTLPRPCEVPPGGLMCDLLWSDPDKRLDTGWAESPRCVSFVFAADVVHNICEKLNLDLIIRAHQVIDHGYQLFADKRLITIFTAPNYCGEFKNLGAIATIDRELVITLTLLDGNNQQDKMTKTSKRNWKKQKKAKKQGKEIKENSKKTQTTRNIRRSSSVTDLNPKEHHINKIQLQKSSSCNDLPECYE